MKKIFIMLCCTLLQLVHMQRINAQTNLIQNSGFEVFDPTCCTGSTCGPTGPAYFPYFNNSSLSGYEATFNPLCVSNWKSSQGSADLAILNCLPFNGSCPTCRETMLYLPECRGNFAAMGGAPQYDISEGIFTENLSLSPDSVYTLSFYIASPRVISSSPFIRLSNGLINNTNTSNNSIPTPINSQTIFTTPLVKDLNKWEHVSVDFVPNAQYSQLWIYLISGWINIDDISLTVKAPYTGPVTRNLPCCGSDIIYSNTTLPSGTTQNESIIVKQNTILPNGQNAMLTAGNFIKFSPDITLTATNSTTLTASIVACKRKPLSENFGGAGTLTSPSCNYNNLIGVPDKLEQGVTYNWTSSPTSALNYIQNTVSPYTILYPLQSINATYTLTASNNCGSISSSIVVTTTCSSRLASSDAVITEADSQTDLIYYPNPTNGKFTLKVPENLLNTDFQISDITGKNILKGSTVQLENTIDMTGQPSGVYYIILHNKGEIIREKLIIL